MRRFVSCCFVTFLCVLGINLKAQDTPTTSKDTLSVRQIEPVITNTQIEDSLIHISTLNVAPTEDVVKMPLLPEQEFKPNPTKAVIYSAIFPGAGQFYNRKYWKIPIVYGGVLGLVYAISWNGGKYNDYQAGYKSIMSGGDEWRDMLPNGGSGQSRDAWTDTFRRQRDFFRRNRDLAIICTVGVYALCMIDAYVDAHLYNFDVSPDLSLHVMPTLWGPNTLSGDKVSFGLQCNIIF